MATLHRFFVEKIGQETYLTGDEYSHAKNVLRLKEGDEVLLLDGSGREYDAVIAQVGKREMLLNVLGSNPSDKECSDGTGRAEGDGAGRFGDLRLSFPFLLGVHEREQASAPAEGRAGGGQTVPARHRSRDHIYGTACRTRFLRGL